MNDKNSNRARPARLDLEDMAKALTIPAVIWGHGGKGTDASLYRMILYAFHMPVFFLAAGLVARRAADTDFSRRGWLEFFRKNIALILMPYLLWGLIYSRFSLPKLVGLLYGSYEQIKTVTSIGALWFLPCFFLTRLEARCVLWLSSRMKRGETLTVLIAAVIAFVIGAVLPKPEKGYPWSFNISFMGLGFYLLGYAAKGLIDRLRDGKFIVKLGLFAASAALFCAGTVLRRGQMELVGFFNGEYGDLFWFFCNAVTGCATVLCLAAVLTHRGERHRAFLPYRGALWVGQNTMGLYLVHTPIMREWAVPLLQKHGFTSPNWLITFVAMLMTLLVSCIVCTLFNRFMPWLFGKNGKNPTQKKEISE